MILDSVNNPSDLKKLNKDELSELSAEIRDFLIKNVSKTGGHLASNLGVVELTLALHLTFDLPHDKIIWDVGHQSYVHKLLTGRRDKFHTLRQFGGISGFPKTSESEFDSFNTGHSATSISAALGMAIASQAMDNGQFINSGVGADDSVRPHGEKTTPLANAATPPKEGNLKPKTIAVIGDGALTGGMAFEALNHAGAAKSADGSKIPLIVVLNDNGMSISENVGGVARYLNKIRNTPLYFHTKDNVKGILRRIPLVGKPLQKLIRNSKTALKTALIGGKMFENFGLTYLGPIDGHDINALSRVLRRAARLDEPVLVHVLTQKGRGYSFAEENPGKFHGIGAFDLETGDDCVGTPCAATFSDVFGEKLCSIAESHSSVAAITAAMPAGTGLSAFAERFPHRFFDVGIAEQHAVTMAAGMAAGGQVPVVAVYSTFLQRAYDQILHDVALNNLHVVFAIDRAGCVGRDGETHQGIYDLSYLLHIPNMTILAPSNTDELAEMLDFAVSDINSPVAIRYPRAENSAATEHNRPPVEYGKGELVRNGSDVLLISIGAMLQTALDTAKILQSRGISAAVINARFAKPLDIELIEQVAAGCKIVATIEDNVEIGGFGSYVEGQLGRRIAKFAFPDKPIEQGSIEEIFEEYDLTAEIIAEKLAKLL